MVKNADWWFRYADVVPVFARDVADGKVKCFIVRKGAPGYHAEPIPHKIVSLCPQWPYYYEECRGSRFRPFGKYQWFW